MLNTSADPHQVADHEDEDSSADADE